MRRDKSIKKIINNNETKGQVFFKDYKINKSLSKMTLKREGEGKRQEVGRRHKYQ